MTEQHQPMPEAAIDPNAAVELGRELVRAREARGWTAQQVAERLHLASSLLLDLEQGRVHRVGAPVYARGFLRSYARLVGVAERRVDDVIPPEQVQSPLPRSTATARRRNPWLERYTWAASYLVGTALLLPAVWWLLQTENLGVESQEPERGRVERAVPAEAPGIGAEPARRDSFESTGSILVGEAVPAAVSGSAAAPPLMASLSPFPRGFGTELSAPPGTEAFSLSVSADSWLEINDASGKRLEFGILRAGSRRDYAGQSPFTLRIGNVNGARITVAEREFDPRPYARANVANVRLVIEPEGTARLEGLGGSPAASVDGSAE